MSSLAVEIGPQHPVAVLKHTELTPPRIICPTAVASSISAKEEAAMDDIIGSPQVQPSTSSGDKDPKKKSGAGFNIKKTAKNVVSGIKRKKKGLEEDERSKSHEELSTDIGDQAAANKGKTKNLTLNKMLSSFSNPSQKFNKMWSSLNKKSFTSTPSQDQYTKLTGTRSTMTLGRFFGKKRDTESDMPPLKEERKAQTLGRMFHFKTPSKNKPQNEGSGAPIGNDTKEA